MSINFQNKLRVLLLGGGLQALSVARSLNEIGCIVTDFIDEKDYVAKCKFIDYKVFSPLFADENNYKQFLYDYLSKYPQKVIIPMSDKLSDLLSRNKEEIERLFEVQCAIPEYGIFKVAYDKWELLKICAEYNLPHPRTMLLYENNLEIAAKYVGFPALIKPNKSVGARGITLVNNMDELSFKYLAVQKSYGNCTLQEFIDNQGPYYNVMLYRDRNGRIVNHTVIEIIRYYPVKGGSSCFCRTIKNNELIKLCAQTLEILMWIGFADFDILQNKNGEFKIIEINPRVPASIRAASISGVNFPSLIVNDLLNNPLQSYDYQEGMFLRYLGLDIMWFLASPERFKAKPSWFTFIGKKLYYQEGGYKDLWAMLFSIWNGFKKAINPSFRKSKSGL